MGPAVATAAVDAVLNARALRPLTADRQIARTRRVRAERDNARVGTLLEELVSVARDETRNIMPVTIELVREGATMGEITGKLKSVWGTYRETPVF